MSSQATSSQTLPVRRPIWVDPPDNWENLDLLGYAALPAVGALATILSFVVPEGRNGVIKKVANNFVGGGWTAGTGELYWQILIDGAPPPGATSYDQILDSLGSPASPVEIAGFRISENQTLTVVVKNVSIVVANQLAGARLLGWTYPKQEELDTIWV